MGRWSAAWPESVHLIGVGGVAMSGLAAVLAAGGAAVRGSDKALYPPASTMLESAGITLLQPFDAAHLDPRPALVVVGNAISRGNVELERALAEGLPIASMSEVIERLLVPGRRVTAIAGTHGKTTTTSIVSWLQTAAGLDPTFLIGGQPGNFEVGARLGAGRDLVLEADEYDTAFFDKGPKFLHYWPSVAILGPVEFDHADIYDDLAAVERAFSWYVRLVPQTGTLVVHDHPSALRLANAARARVVVTGLRADAEITLRDRVDDAEGQRFTLWARGAEVGAVRLALSGEHNARNALAALAAVEVVGVPLAQAVRALADFRGPRRRLERIADRNGVLIFDDFAHHPTAVEQTLGTVRRLVAEGGRLVACLEPRSNTMVRSVFGDRLFEALASADLVWIGQVDRPERLAAEERLDVAALVARLQQRGVVAHGPCSAEQIRDGLCAQTRPGDRVVLMSNGGFGGLAGMLRSATL